MHKYHNEINKFKKYLIYFFIYLTKKERKIKIINYNSGMTTVFA
jgi:hypothetical protein